MDISFLSGEAFHQGIASSFCICFYSSTGYGALPCHCIFPSLAIIFFLSKTFLSYPKCHPKISPKISNPLILGKRLQNSLARGRNLGRNIPSHAHHVAHHGRATDELVNGHGAREDVVEEFLGGGVTTLCCLASASFFIHHPLHSYCI